MKDNFKNKILVYRIQVLQDTDSFGQLYDLYIDKIYRFIYFKIYNIDDAKDLTSEVFLKTWQYLKENNKIKNFNALIYQIAKNIVIDYFRKKTTFFEEDSEFILEKVADNFSQQQQESVHLSIEMAGIAKFLPKLKHEYREVLLLKYVEDYSIKEIAAILNKTNSNVKVLLHRAVKKLQEVMDKNNFLNHEQGHN